MSIVQASRAYIHFMAEAVISNLIRYAAHTFEVLDNGPTSFHLFSFEMMTTIFNSRDGPTVASISEKNNNSGS